MLAMHCIVPAFACVYLRPFCSLPACLSLRLLPTLTLPSPASLPSQLQTIAAGPEGYAPILPDTSEEQLVCLPPADLEEKIAAIVEKRRLVS